MDICLLDMDGVIADFNGSIRHVIGKPAKKDRPQPYELHLLYDLTPEEVVNKIRNLDRDFWINISTYPWSERLVDHLLDKFQNQVVILSCPNVLMNPTYAPLTTEEEKDRFVQEAKIGKTIWIENHFPQLKDRIYFHCDKGKYARALRSSRDLTVLVDDSEYQISRFQKEGGDVVLFPMPWNRNWIYYDNGESLDYTINQIESLFKRKDANEQGVTTGDAS